MKIINPKPLPINEEILSFRAMNKKQLNDKRTEFLNARNIISFELEKEKRLDSDKYNSEWSLRAKAAHKIIGVKIGAIEAIIGEMNEGSKRFFKHFYSVAKHRLPRETFDLLEEEAEILNHKDM